MAVKFEYIRVRIDAGDLAELNSLSSLGWRVVGLFNHEEHIHGGGVFVQWYALLERMVLKES